MTIATSNVVDATVAPDAAAFPDPARVDQGFAAVRGDGSIQFDLPARAVPPTPKTPEWIEAMARAIGDFLKWTAPIWPVIFWIMVALLVLALVIAIFPSTRHAALALWARRRKAATGQEPETWTPQESVARQLLAEADALAAQGRYDEAVHLILFRSIEDIEGWRGDIVRPSLTSRDIARADALPDTARSVFGRIVAAVERSLFGGRALGIDDWTTARGDYAAFALKQAA